MKQLLPPANATFNASAGTITFATTIPLTISHILHITNVTRGVLYFQPQAGALFTGTYASPVLTLAASTIGHADADKLEIFYDDGLAGPPVTIADGADITLGAKADAKSTATDTTPISAISVLKQISASCQAPPSSAVTNAGTFAVQLAAQPSAANTACSQVAASGSAATLIAARATRRKALLRNLDTALSFYIGVATVTSANGMLVQALESIVWESPLLCQIIAPSGAPICAIIDYYD